MARVTDAEVKEILDTALSTTPFINTATVVVDENLVDKGLSTALLKEIELYLAAHYTTIREQQLTSEELGEAKNTYQGKTEMGLDSSFYGQTAKQLDTSGTLSNIGMSVAEIQVF